RADTADHISTGRQQKKNEALANQILGSGRRKSAPGAGITNTRKAATAAPSLASRMGITKRSNSATPKINGRNGAAFGSPLNAGPRIPRGPAQLPRTQSASRVERGSQLPQQVQTGYLSNGPTAQRNATKGASGINIKGMGSGYTVIASNFAPGTTAGDIEAVMAPIGGEMNYCRLTTASPTVIAEMQFVNYEGAQNVISMFNNRKADGRLLYVYMKSGTGALPASTPTGPARVIAAERDEMDVDDRSSSDYRQPEPRPIRRAEPEYQDGRYGFRDPTGRDSYGWNERRDRGGPGLYSDNMMRNDARGYRR
ncbi:hypothetical protein K490DRAFT_43923, partial [Saccharata proteae CBS 121410]